MSENSCCKLNNKSIYGQFCGECPDCRTVVKEKALVEKDGEKVAKKKVRILSTLDVLISVFVVTPLVVACWRGTWQLMDVYASYFPPWESFIIGTLIHIVVGISQESFDGLVNKKHKSRLCNACAFMFMKLYTIVLNGVTNMHWRGGWCIVDEYFGTRMENGRTILEDPRGSFCFFTICFLILFAMRCLRNLNSPPFEICLDYGDHMFLFPNMFKVKASETISLYVLDVIFSISIVSNLGMFVWRGIWLLFDVFYFPQDEVRSAWGSLILGYIIIAIVFLLQPFMKKLCDNLNGIPKLLVADAYMMASVIAVIVTWRAIWMLLNIYFLPENEELSCWITMCVPMLILMIMGCSNSVLVRGVCLDAEEPDGSCVIFPCNYLKVIFDQEKYDTWFNIWTGKGKKTDLNNMLNGILANQSHTINVINYHLININDDEKNEKNNNVNKNGVS
ncbi:uncharacterized protein LOC126742571 [Anthonomus grandis grandis]|uniref:uncharacterized protein LOC126742571 n=1 Tax=Anthonomus grandis grandis TaxID=2921223 RepID=UPI002166A92B|nr:uncharacterized protein LOC126742571 [Anthonomus grandis grandis]